MTLPEPVARIYAIRNKVNGWIYIGATKYTIRTRFNQHVFEASFRRNAIKRMKKGVYSEFYSDINKYGEEAFTVELVEEIYEKSLVEEVEQYWIDKFFGNKCYNVRRSVYSSLQEPR